MQLLFLLLLLPLLSDAAPSIAQPGCNSTCGDITIPFPFGVGLNCYLNSWFEIDCNGSRPILSKLGFELMEVNINHANQYGSPTVIVGIQPFNVCNTDAKLGIDLRRSPYNISTQYNTLVMEGCPGSVSLVTQSKKAMTGCATVCSNNNNDTDDCFGVQCCQAQLSSVSFGYFPFYEMNFNGQTALDGHQNCLVATLVKIDSVNRYAGKLSALDPSSVVPVVLSWSWMSNLEPANANCSHDQTTNSTYCECAAGYHGNPYLSDGCQVNEECKDCRGYCRGKWNSTTGHLISGTYSCEKRTIKNLPAILGLSIGFGIVLLALVLCRLYYFIRTTRETSKKAKFFKRNGGFLLQQQLTSNEGFVEKTKIFTISELEKATDYFNENRILGQGGQGTVYKGMLTDGRIVAIKKSKQLDESQLEQFINEVAILSQISHKHVVKLLGCCLETEVPLLVYEFISNGTLSQHIHDPEEGFVMSWEMRLRIAADSAAAIAYLHSSSYIPIYHRDIKSTNILLDDKYTAKVSDFGSSKTIAVDQTHFTTLVQGTMGYLDPEYMQTYKFSDKSDVYSFGVVLLELLTRKKPIYRASTMEQMNLVTEFMYLIKNSHLSNIVDPQVMKEASEEDLKAVVELAKRCLCWKGRLRPTMKQVSMALDMIIKSPAQVSDWDQHVFRDDGFSDIDMSEMSDGELLSNPLPVRAHIDVQPLLPNTM